MKVKDQREVLLDKKMAASYLMVSTKTIDNYRKAGTIRAYRAGGKILFKKSELFGALTPASKISGSGK